MDGGYSKTEKATEEVHQICDKVKTKAEAKAGQTFDQFQAISYRQQVVAGMNYLIESLPNPESTLEVTGIKTGMKKIDPLEPFN